MTRYTVTINAPGYLPDKEPVTGLTWAEAVEMLKTEIGYTAQLFPMTANELHRIEGEVATLTEADALRGDATWQLCGLAHSITPDIEPETWTKCPDCGNESLDADGYCHNAGCCGHGYTSHDGYVAGGAA